MDSTLPSTPTASPPAVPRPDAAAARAADAGDDLDARIVAAEHRLIAREEDLQRRLRALTSRVKTAAQPGRFVLPAIGALASLVFGWVLWRRRPAGGSSGHAVPSAAPAAVGGSDGSWVRLIGLAWPLLPMKWRSRVNPAMASAALSIGVPVLERLVSRAPSAPLPTAPQVDLVRYAGTWFEIARMPQPFEAACEGQPTATYTPAGGVVEVLNRCPDGEGGERVAHGVARVVPDSGNAKLEVSFLPEWLRWLPFGWADYWVLYVDKDYRFALVGHPNRRALWVLSRSRRLDLATFQALVGLARDHGFPVERLQIVQPDLPASGVDRPAPTQRPSAA